MAYRFDLAECPRDGIRRIAIEQIGSAERPLSHNIGQHAVNDARKSIKRTREQGTKDDTNVSPIIMAANDKT